MISCLFKTNDMKALIFLLLQVAGPTGWQKCISAGLLKTVIDLLDAAEPVQVRYLDVYLLLKKIEKKIVMYLLSLLNQGGHIYWGILVMLG